MKPPCHTHPYHGHAILADPSLCLLYQISSTETRILVDVIGKLPTGALQAYLCDKVMSQLPENLRSYFLKAVMEKAIKSMPSKYFPAKPPALRGALMIGDALNMRNPLTGGGMTVAIRDAETLAQCLADVDVAGDSYEYIEQQYAAFLQIRKGYSSTINVLANALHAVFSTPKGDATRQDIRTACYDYLVLVACMLQVRLGCWQDSLQSLMSLQHISLWLLCMPSSASVGISRRGIAYCRCIVLCVLPAA